MKRFAWSSDDSIICKPEPLQTCSRMKISKRAVINDCNNQHPLENVQDKRKMIDLLYVNNIYMLEKIIIHAKRRLKLFDIHLETRREYYNDFDKCSKDFGKLAQMSKENSDNEENHTVLQSNQDHSAITSNTTKLDDGSSNESLNFLDADDLAESDMKWSGFVTKSIINTNTAKSSEESTLFRFDSLTADINHDLKFDDSRTNMTVMTIVNKDIPCEGDWKKEREVLLMRDENRSFGISIVGGTVNVSDDNVVSGIFIKNIIPKSPADRCGLLKIGDRILAVDGLDIRCASHEHAMKTIKAADEKMVLLVQSLVKKLDDKETSTLMKKIPPPITPCKTPELELIHEGTSDSKNTLAADGNQENMQKENGAAMVESEINNRANTPLITTDSENSSDDEDVRDLEGRTFTAGGMEIDRASAGNIKRTKEEIALDTEEEDCFGYTTKKIKKRYGTLGLVFCHTIEKTSNGSLGLSLAGHRDRNKMACFIVGINPKGISSSSPFEVGDEILEVNGLVLHKRSHLNVPVIIKGIAGSSLKFVILRKKTASEDIAVKPITQFPTSIEGPAGLGIMIIEGKHAEVGQGIFVSDIQEGSSADKAGLNIGELILSVNKDSLIGCSYEAAASLLKKAEGVVTLKICNPNKAKESQDTSEKIDASNENSSAATSGANTAKESSKPANQKPQPSPAKEVVDPSKTEVIENENTLIELSTEKNPLGIMVTGGCDSRINTGAVIVDILPNSIACKDKRLQVFDQILEINGTKITAELTENQIQKAVKQLQPKVRMVVYRANPAQTENTEIELTKKSGKQFGIAFRTNHRQGITVTELIPGGIAESDGKIQKGDIVTHLNSELLNNASMEDCSALVKTVQGKVTFTILRPKPKLRVL
ncbi:inactivation-no-after-potential D protein isoform X3 [Toxorhynchites rutilus septentrionalis]|uniref:inactivation-no-after-potential D protein isoform X3 n=1 Tax=Toxorhynchites rutilus septentrionalis TaxID=329112 RepID=UPI00247A208B|nr:inactivation-no-after-potential D protein isoform X3 [Toxorhynchites rutilus septentrionalis]